MSPSFNPFAFPQAVHAPAAPAPTWGPPITAPAVSTAPPNAAIDRATGEVFFKPLADGSASTVPWDKDDLLLSWQASQEALEIAKAREMKYRKMVVACFTNPDVNKGTERVELGNGYELKTVKSITYKVGSKTEGVSTRDAINNALQRIHDYVGPGVEVGVGALIAERIVKTSYDLSVSEYNKIPAPLKAIIDEVITTTDGAPKVEVIAPKKEAIE